MALQVRSPLDLPGMLRRRCKWDVPVIISALCRAHMARAQAAATNRGKLQLQLPPRSANELEKFIGAPASASNYSFLSLRALEIGP